MVLVRDRCSEQREDAVPGGLHDVAAVATHRIDHQLQRWIDDRARLLGVEVLFQFSRALDVSEQRGHRLALAVKRLAGRLLGCYSDTGRAWLRCRNLWGIGRSGV